MLIDGHKNHEKEKNTKVAQSIDQLYKKETKWKDKPRNQVKVVKPGKV